ncbi:hypothetical protein AVI56_01190 [Piscirickettsia salmonis]|uniref:hypothetical protein n=1 Tax=Piscirickettsia salmonis TaxID=1238 RepID=UPI00094A320F|nr:hypothetical protein [Piscirickettsia salmonis]APS69095.1 hypothetical protein AVI56_01190 [Piscirickettsia salmonis]
MSRGEFEVTKKFYDGTFNKKYELDSKTILAISKLIGKKYEFMDKFIYELKGLVPELSDKKIESLLKVAKKINKMDGYYNSCYSNSEAELSDLAHFNEGKTRNQQQDVTVTSLQEVIREKQLYQRYVDEKLGLQGQTKTAYDPKDPEKKRARAKLKKRMVKHRLLPWGKFQSNCNKTSATIIQQAMNKDQQVSPKQHQLVKTSTGWSVGSGKRMYIHSSLPFFQSVIKNNPVSKTSNMEVNLE